MIWFIGLTIALFCYLSSLMSCCFVRTKIEEKNSLSQISNRIENGIKNSKHDFRSEQREKKAF